MRKEEFWELFGFVMLAGGGGGGGDGLDVEVGGVRGVLVVFEGSIEGESDV